MPPDLLLRTPPFPSTTPAIVAVSVADAASPAGSGEGLAAAIRAARVGGEFWAAAPAVPDGAIILSRPDAATITAFQSEGPVFARLSDSREGRAMARLLAARGIDGAIDPVDPWAMLARAARVVATGDDELALLALIAGVRVRCTAPGRVTGHGLCEGEAPAADREAALDALLGETLHRDVRYRDPFTGMAATVMETIARLAEWRRLIDANRGLAVGAGIALWKRRAVTPLLWGGGGLPRFARTPARAIRIARAGGGAIAAWPSRVPARLMREAETAGVPVHRIEDGFVRSVGLGVNLHPPLSIVVDTRGIYYDPTRPSDLETLLAETDFTPALLARARALGEAIVRAGITKYAAGPATVRFDSPPGRRRVLVAGQVEDDLSVRLGGGDVAGNLDLLRRARAAEPDAWLAFKPHPDVDAGHRVGRIDDSEALRHVDRIVRGVAMPALLDAVDGVHVLTSLTGYEALLRGRDVTVHGGPFYAGWGLTRDLGPALPRRARTLSLDALTAAALILYPRYLDPETGLPCPSEVLVERLARQAAPRETPLIRLRRAQGWLRRAWSPIGIAT